jgi:hypothetical protein
MPYNTPGLLSIWCSHADVCNSIILSIDKLLQNNAQASAKTYFICSNNKYNCVDMTNANEELDYFPQDKAEVFLEEYLSKDGVDTTNYAGTQFKKKSIPLSQSILEIQSLDNLTILRKK